ncbi:hypothetical protein B0H14DRAFT_3465002 [Mycena olivaceomarginata]|nr:hypothetical protein B0H14DRAFT_3465002 [Mycena olivaceomarginata]
MFQDYFLPGAKRARNTRSQSSTNPCAPTIYVAVNTGPSGGNEVYSVASASKPLGTITAASVNADNANIPTSLYRSHSFVADGKENTSSDAICYPSVTEILQSIDNSGVFEDSAELTFPGVIFADTLQVYA